MKKSTEIKNFRVKQFIIEESHPYFPFLLMQLHYSKNLYNATLYELRQRFFKKEAFPENLDKVMKVKKSNRSDKLGFDYYNMATCKSAQQTMMKAHRSMIYFQRSLRKYKKDPRNYTGKPKIPKYKRGKYYIVTLTNQSCKVKGNIVHFPRTYGNFTLDISDCFTNNDYDFKSLSEVRYYLKKNTIIVEVVYQVKAKYHYPLRKDRLCGIDLGVAVFAACSFNFNKNPIIIDSSYVKSINQLYNKKIAKYQSLAKKCNDLYVTKRLSALWSKRHRKIKDYMHKASSLLVKICLENRVSKIIIGENKNWKRKNKKKQNFTYIPFSMFKSMVEYKAKLYGIKVIFVPEMYTSGTSFLDKETPQKKFYNKKRRVTRGIFYSNGKIGIHSDVNAGYQMIKKYELKENQKRKRQTKKSLISCFNKTFNWKKIASNVERVYVM